MSQDLWRERHQPGTEAEYLGNVHTCHDHCPCQAPGTEAGYTCARCGAYPIHLIEPCERHADRKDPRMALYERDLDYTRDPAETVERARNQWTPWHPGDGTRYSARLLRITEGADLGDEVLLLNVIGHTAAFSFPVLAYRQRERGPWTRKRAREHGNAWAWDAAKPLLDQLSATKIGAPA